MRKARRFAVLGAMAGLVLLGGFVVAAPAIEGALRVESPLAKADALVLMAGCSVERLPEVVRLYEEGVAPRILLTNDGVSSAWSFDHGRNLYQVEWEELELIERGVPPEAIVTLGFTVSGTIHDALNTRAFVRADGGIRSLAVVTSDFHTRRTLWSFRKVFAGEPVEIAIHGVEARDGRELGTVAVEWLKFAVYRLRYGWAKV